MTKPTLIAVALLLCVEVGFCKSPATTDASVCTITKHPTRFQGKNVRIRALASSGMEAAVLLDPQDEKCGVINLDFHSVANDGSTQRFLKLFGTQLGEVPPCNKDEELRKGLAHVLDPNIPAPAPCVTMICIACPRYRIVATFIGKVRYSRTGGFGHLGMFELQLDVAGASDLDVSDNLAR